MVSEFDASTLLHSPLRVLRKKLQTYPGLKRSYIPILGFKKKAFFSLSYDTNTTSSVHTL